MKWKERKEYKRKVGSVKRWSNEDKKHRELEKRDGIATGKLKPDTQAPSDRKATPLLYPDSHRSYIYFAKYFFSLCQLNLPPGVLIIKK